MEKINIIEKSKPSIKNYEDDDNFLKNVIEKNRKRKSSAEVPEVKKQEKHLSVPNDEKTRVQENLHIQKQRSIKQAIDSTQEFSKMNSGITDNLFDQVLTQVKERNKGKIYY